MRPGPCSDGLTRLAMGALLLNPCERRAEIAVDHQPLLPFAADIEAAELGPSPSEPAPKASASSPFHSVNSLNQ